MSFQLINQAVVSRLRDSLWEQMASSAVSSPLNDDSLSIATGNVSVPVNAPCSSFCQDENGWGPISPEFDDFTLCFINGGLFTLINTIFIWRGFSELRKIYHSKRQATPYRKNYAYYLRFILTLFQLALAIITAINVYGESNGTLKDVKFIQPVLQSIAFIVGVALQHFDYRYNKITSGNLLLFILFSAGAGFFKMLNLVWRKQYDDDYFILSTFTFINTILLLLATWLPVKPQTYQTVEKVNPFDTADVFARLTFSWMTPLMKLGYQTFLTEDDLPPLPREFKSGYISEVFGKNWRKRVDKSSTPSLGWALLETFGPSVLAGAFFKAIQDILQFTQPQMLKLLIKFVDKYNSDSPESLAKGTMIVIFMFLISIIQTACLHQYFWLIFNVGMNIKSSLTATIYKKSLKLSSEARGEKASGDIVNLMSVDTQRLQDLANVGSLIWSGPFQIILCLISLHGLLGNSMWIGVFIMVILIPLNSMVMRYMKTLQKKQMKNKDERTRIIGEILNNIKSLKLYGWEKPYKEKLNHVRNDKELMTMKQMNKVQAYLSFQFNMSSFFVSCATFGVYVWTQDAPLTTDMVFPALTLFNLLSFPLATVPMALTSFVEAQVAIGRLVNFLTAEELQPDAVTYVEKASKKGDVSVEVKDGTFLWQRKPEYKVALSKVNFVAKKGELTCIVGRVGSGKSALIQSILGDLNRIDGSVTIHGNVAYVSQIPWIMNGTVKENILFGHKYDPEFYDKTIKACALTIDFATLKDGDETLVGEKGISLSGGQKARISLARAVYSRADVYLMDDPLAAVDEHVGKHLTDHVLSDKGLLGSKAKILATNKISVLSIANNITLMQDGAITQQGTYDEVMSVKDSVLNQLISEYGSKKVESPDVKEENINVEDLVSDENSTESTFDALSLRRASVSTLRSLRFGQDDSSDGRKEHREQGKVKWSIYTEYAKACNPKYVMLFLVFVFAPQMLQVVSSVWLKHWSEVNTKYGYNITPFFYLGGYFGIGLLISGAVLLQSIILWQFCSIQASIVLHSNMVDSVLRAPMQFFETTPIGRILNRFSNDIYKIDEILARTFNGFISNVVKVTLTIIVICYSTWQFTFMVVPLLFVYLLYQKYYMMTSRELRRLDSVTRSPIYAHFQETLAGTSTIRGFSQEKRFEHINQSRVDNNMSAYFPSVNTNRWLAVRLEFLGSLIILGAAASSIFTLKYGSITSGLVGLSVSYSLQITQALNWIVRMTVEVETNIVAVERVNEYSRLEPEAAEIIEPRPAASWPEKGEIVFKDYSTRYREGLDLVLKNINIKINPKEKIGIVGRTGAGKSSLTLALYRIIEAASGEILIDGVPTNTVGLEDLRHKLSIIPQDSQVFEGTIRDNIDPTNQYTDEEIWNALELSHLKQHVIAMSDTNEGLDVMLSEGGSNLSVGQRQLMCLARALLIPSSILVLDEATAAVDVETDEIVQETIRKSFKDRTILTIAHRLNTIMDSDRIIVLDKGTVKEFDTPENLLKNKDSIFYALVNAGKDSGVIDEDK
ncbi:CYFA0S22e00100g1_1 [Cyberlindnera fabianii]|uniref:CYFA0S22e00100g1_1 n=1 Tax=Cyberlindnera fabianii TaxID=36022 RepID=A0A061BE00_CYBFA|nr:CYFA0S22e00100g1_1 [Cyberlindnera fabianii]